jgi:hypothetical protein
VVQSLDGPHAHDVGSDLEPVDSVPGLVTVEGAPGVGEEHGQENGEGPQQDQQAEGRRPPPAAHPFAVRGGTKFLMGLRDHESSHIKA